MDSATSLTFRLPVDLTRRAQVFAAEHDTTIEALVQELLQEALSRGERARGGG